MFGRLFGRKKGVKLSEAFYQGLERFLKENLSVTEEEGKEGSQSAPYHARTKRSKKSAVFRSLSDESMMDQAMTLTEKTGLPTPKPLDEKNGLPSPKPLDEEAGLPLSKPLDEEAGLPLAKPLNGEAGAAPAKTSDIAFGMSYAQAQSAFITLEKEPFREEASEEASHEEALSVLEEASSEEALPVLEKASSEEALHVSEETYCEDALPDLEETPCEEALSVSECYEVSAKRAEVNKKTVRENVKREGLKASLKTARPRSLEDTISQVSESWQQSLFRIIDEKGADDVEVYKTAGLDRKLFSKIRSNRAYQPKKNTALLLALALRLNLDETKDMLARAGFALSKSSKTDLIIEYFIENGVHDIYTINLALYEHDEACL